MAITRTAQRLALVGLAVVAAVSLSGCSGTPSGAVTNYSGWPAVSMPGEGGSGELADGSPHAVWLDNGEKLAVITYGSSTCPLVGSSIDVVQDANNGNVVKVNLAAIPSDKACTLDLVPHTTEFWTPQRVTTTQKLTVQVNGSTVTVPVKSGD